MSILSTDLVAYASASRPEDDVSATGGAINPDVRLVFSQLAANDTLRVFSSDADDITQTITVKGRKADGAIATATADLNGTGLVTLSPATTFERVLSAILDADCEGDVTLERVTTGDDIGIIPAGERGFAQVFIGSVSESAQAIRYEKGFFKNNHATLTLTSAKVKLTADPSTKIKIGLAAAKDDSGSVANRKAAPGGISFVDDNVDIDVPDTTLEAASAIGVWFEQTLSAYDAPVRSTFTVQPRGQST